MKAPIKYRIIYSKNNCSEWSVYNIDLTLEEEIAYNVALQTEVGFTDNPILDDVLSRAYVEIADYETERHIKEGNQYALECSGKVPINFDEIKKAALEGDDYVLDFFHLEHHSKEELEAWILSSSELPMIKDFEPDFFIKSPFDGDWILDADFAPATI